MIIFVTFGVGLSVVVRLKVHEKINLALKSFLTDGTSEEVVHDDGIGVSVVLFVDVAVRCFDKRVEGHLLIFVAVILVLKRDDEM